MGLIKQITQPKKRCAKGECAKAGDLYVKSRKVGPSKQIVCYQRECAKSGCAKGES